METNYEVGKTYPLSLVSTILKDDTPFIVATDGNEDFTIRPFDYQMEYSIFPRVIKGYVRKIGFTGRPYFEQLKDQVLKDRYFRFGTAQRFVVDEVQMDSKTSHVFYVLSDEFGIQHRYYPDGEETLKKSGDNITLVVKGIVASRDGKNNARLDLVAPTAGAKPVTSAPKTVSSDDCFI